MKRSHLIGWDEAAAGEGIEPIMEDYNRFVLETEEMPER
jgi:hypothetical protein